ncbi:glycosyltransferase family 31 protein [Stemphylium lycopersici]|uniref:Glycosyltransferase family 31 protein n=1 Tax=Stemphylium lycopersici TaxID=183478 RepID=A0A364N015_STELY|nr:glycosyltransferase family 31 protein [Stemphylium lycopersici]RAR08231.1 glycosyltransferase family 31 protein [Stemphylium lycopersici]
MSSYRKHMPRTTRIIFGVFLTYAFIWLKGWPRTYDDEELAAVRPPPQEKTSLGPHPVQRAELIVSVTTTAVDAYAKVAPFILNTDQQDHGQLLLFSDLQTEIGKWPVFDVIWRLTPDVVMKTKELERYRTQLDFGRRGVPLQKLRKADPEEERRDMVLLEKYKILQAMAAAWDYRPGRSWYVFAGHETYVNRPNLLDWLSQHDPDAKHYFANPPASAEANLPDPFAPAGTSFIVSRQVMKELFEARKDVVKKWAKNISDYQSPFDLVTSVLETELKIGFASVWPGISGFDPSTVPFEPSLWCEPVLMMHHVASDMGSDLFKMEQEHPSDQPIRFADLWERFFTPENLNYTRHDWDNLSSDSSNGRWNILFEGDQPDANRARKGEDSLDACQQSCEESKYCVQWSYSTMPQTNWNDNPETRCHLSSSIRFGGYVERQEFEINDEKMALSWHSGWKKEKFQNWARRQRCNEHHQ